MVWFLYFSNYPHLEDFGEFGIFDGLRFSLHVSVHTLAMKYEVPPLALLAKKHFIKAVKKHWNILLFHDCIPVIYGAQPEPNSTFRKIVTQKLKLNLEWCAKRSDLRDDFQRYVQNFPLFACDVPAALYAKPMPKPGLTLEGGTKEHWDDGEPGRSIFSLPPCYTGFVKRSLDDIYVPIDEYGHRYKAALFMTNPRGIQNKYCYLRIVLCCKVQAKDLYITHFEYGTVGEPEPVKTLVRTSEGCLMEFNQGTGVYLSDAVEIFEETFKNLTGLDWANRSNQPVKSAYTYIRESQDGLLWGWDNAVSKLL